MAKDIWEYRIYTYKSELDKALHTLEGLLKGIGIDKELNLDEIDELFNWCTLYNKFLQNNPCNELIPLIKKSIEDHYLSQDEVDDILWVCNNFKTGNGYYDAITSDIQRLQGILHGILADNIINDTEIEDLKFWVQENGHLSGTYPFDQVYSLLLSILSDGRIDESERNCLKFFSANLLTSPHHIISTGPK